MPGVIIKKLCPVCNIEFQSLLCQKRKVCSKLCRHKWQKHKLSNGISKNCLKCNKEFYISNSKLKQNYCSLNCFYLANPAKTVECKVCKKFIRANLIHCSVDCMKVTYQTELLGDKNPNWKGGIRTRENSGISSMLRKAILQRDNYQCQDCKVQTNELNLLHIHHIIPFKNGGTEDLENLLTLCFVCHWKGHHGFTLNQNLQDLATKTGCGSYRTDT